MATKKQNRAKAKKMRKEAQERARIICRRLVLPELLKCESFALMTMQAGSVGDVLTAAEVIRRCGATGHGVYLYLRPQGAYCARDVDLYCVPGKEDE